jgi:hypothetical protein
MTSGSHWEMNALGTALGDAQLGPTLGMTLQVSMVQSWQERPPVYIVESNTDDVVSRLNLLRRTLKRWELFVLQASFSANNGLSYVSLLRPSAVNQETYSTIVRTKKKRQTCRFQD